jgi:hypothetical protein
MGLIIAALVAFGGFLALFHAFISITLFTCVRADPNMSLISPDIDVLVIILCLVSAWVLGYIKRDVFSFRTLGTKFYGRKYIENGYIATKWLTVGFPILPIRSYVIEYTIMDIYNIEFEVQKNVMQPFKGFFYFPQMLRTGLISYGTIFWCLGCLWLMFFAMCID